MAQIDARKQLQNLIQRLNATSRNALEAAAGLCLSRAHYEVEIEHFLLKLAESTDNDLLRILRHFRIDVSRFTTDVSRSLNWLKAGNQGTPHLSDSFVKILVDGWSLIDYFLAPQVRSGFAVLAAAQNEEISGCW